MKVTENQYICIVGASVVIALAFWSALVFIGSAAMFIFGRWAAQLLGWY